MNKIATPTELHETPSKEADKSIVSFAAEFGGNIAVLASVDGALGFVAER